MNVKNNFWLLPAVESLLRCSINLVHDSLSVPCSRNQVVLKVFSIRFCILQTEDHVSCITMSAEDYMNTHYIHLHLVLSMPTSLVVGRTSNLWAKIFSIFNTWLIIFLREQYCSVSGKFWISFSQLISFNLVLNF